jgi:hypothetical protein
VYHCASKFRVVVVRLLLEHNGELAGVTVAGKEETALSVWELRAEDCERRGSDLKLQPRPAGDSATGECSSTSEHTAESDRGDREGVAAAVSITSSCIAAPSHGCQEDMATLCTEESSSADSPSSC